MNFKEKITYRVSKFNFQSCQIFDKLKKKKNARIWLPVQFRGLKNLAQQKDGNRAIKKEPNKHKPQTILHPSNKLSIKIKNKNLQLLDKIKNAKKFSSRNAQQNNQQFKKERAIPQHAMSSRAQEATQNPRSLPLALLLSQHQDPGNPIEYQACDYVNVQMHSTISKDDNLDTCHVEKKQTQQP